MPSYIENGYEYVDLKEKSSSEDSESIPIWLWFIIVFVFAIVIFVSIWYIPKSKSRKISDLKNY